LYYLRKFYSQAIAAVLIATALGLLSVQLGHESDYGPAGRLVVEAVSPLQQGAVSAADAVAGVWYGYLDLIGVRQQNERLQEDVRRLRAEVVGYREDRLANARLRKLLAFKETSGLSLLSAQVVGRSATPWFRTVMIDRGSRDGVLRGMTVVVPEGVVGRVISASGGHAKVLLANDRNSAIDALVQRSRVQGIFVGAGDGMGSLKYVARRDDLRRADLVLSSGLGGVFPKGLPLGVVEEVATERAGVFKVVRVRPTVDYGSLEEVMVVTNAAAEPPES
jgi:rod shape-determining protein MreC